MNEALIQSAEQSLLHLAKWNRRVSRLLWILFAILVALEGIIFALYCLGVTLGSTFSVTEYFLSYFLLPCLTVLVTVLIAQIISRKLKMKASLLVRSRFLVCSIIVMVSETVAFHHGINVVYGLYVLPMVISILYVDSRTLLLTFLLSIGFYLLTFFCIIQPVVQEGQYRHSYMDILSTIGILTSVYALSRMILARVKELINTAVEQRIREAELSKALSLDSLTQLYNHATFYDKLDEFILRYRREGQPFSLIVIDIDNFKSVNDRFGHDVGNEVIMKLVEFIERYKGKYDLAFRYGGEEFTILTPDTDRIMLMAEQIRKSMERHTFPGIPNCITISLGVCTYSLSFGGRREFFSAADKALYQAKQSGKNRICVAE